MPQVAEIVTFDLDDGTEVDTFVSAARGTEAVVRAMPGFVRRQLSQGPDGRWTDYVVWQDIEAAQAAAKAVVQEPDFKPFGALISGTGLRMRHEEIRMGLD